MTKSHLSHQKHIVKHCITLLAKIIISDMELIVWWLTNFEMSKLVSINAFTSTDKNIQASAKWAI